jgi:hypothetical protein
MKRSARTRDAKLSLRAFGAANITTMSVMLFLINAYRPNTQERDAKRHYALTVTSTRDLGYDARMYCIPCDNGKKIPRAMMLLAPEHGAKNIPQADCDVAPASGEPLAGTRSAPMRCC